MLYLQSRLMKFGVIIFFPIALSSRPLAAKETPPIIVWAEEVKPYNYKNDNDIVGFWADLVRELIDEAGLNVSQWVLAPWPRAFYEAKSKPNSLLFGIVREPTRENLFYWIGPLGPRSIFLVKLRNRVDIQLDTLDQTKGLTVSVKRKTLAEKKLQSRQMKTVGVTTENSQLKMLLLGRTDLIAISDHGLYFNAQEMDISLDTFEVVDIIDESTEYYIAVNRKTDPRIVTLLQSAFSKFEASGRLLDIRIKWFGKLVKVVQDFN